MQKKRSLGQHFLHSTAYLRAVADAGNVKAGDVVLEIGPGDGALTRELLARSAKVVAVEKDHRLIPLLAEKFANEITDGKLVLHEGDALEVDPATLGLENHHFKLVANIPYYITGALFRKFLSGDMQPSTLVFLVQKEVAERIARSKKESILSLSVKAYGMPKYVKTVPRGAFSPAPSVDSAILLISDISREKFNNSEHEQRFFELIHAGFAQKRKLLKRNIEGVLGQNAAEKMALADIGEKARSEDVPIEKWLTLARA